MGDKIEIDMTRLTAIAVRNFKQGKLSDGNGLTLWKRGESAKWYLRYYYDGNRFDLPIGDLYLGKQSDAERAKLESNEKGGLNLREARAEAMRLRGLVARGIDPRTERKKAIANSQAELERKRHSFETIFWLFFETYKAELVESRHNNWTSPVRVHVLPKIGKTPIDGIDATTIHKLFSPIWQSKQTAAKKAMTRLGMALEFAADRGLAVDVEAVARARRLLGKQVSKVQRMPSMHWQDCPEFYAELSSLQGTLPLALRAIMLTGLRGASVRFAEWGDIDLEAGIWTIPAKNMKQNKSKKLDERNAFAVPITPELERVFEEARAYRCNSLIFPSPSKGAPLSDNLSKFFRDRQISATPHGFRATIKTYLLEKEICDNDFSERVLAHATGNAVSRAYERGNFLERRREILLRWDSYIAPQSAKIIEIRGAK